MSKRIGLRTMGSIGGKKIGEIGSFLYGGAGSPILGYANLWNVPLHISEIGDLSSAVPVAKNVDCIGSNGQYWLVGFHDEVLYKFDGVNWTILLEGDADYTCEAIKWNGSYWIIIYRFDKYNRLYKYDGASVTLVESLENATWRDLAWSSTVEWWIIVGDSYALPTVGKAWKWDGATLTDISDKVVGSDEVDIEAVDWFTDYWLLGGEHGVNYKYLKKYYPLTETAELIIPPKVSGDTSGGSVSSIKVGGGVALIGERYELGGYQSLYKWDGENITLLTLFNFNSGGVFGIDYAEDLFFIVGTDTVTNYETYHYPQIRTYNPATGAIETISPPWNTGALNATAYTSKIF